MYGSFVDDMIRDGRIYDVYVNYNEYVSITNAEVDAEIEQANISFEVDSVYLRVGALHNLLLAKLRKPVLIEEPIIVASANGGGLMPPGGDDDGTMVPGGFIDPLIANPAFQADYRILVQEALDDPYKLIGEEGETLSAADTIANLFIEACDYALSQTHLARIADQYYKQVESDATLSQSDKQSLTCMFAVALYSANYWNFSRKFIEL